ncbi:Gluconate 5-dehydrogenase [Frankia canadensis]|uniref:Gluconate 5-dehydrogenase n=1 Tax=Frankia canadensis TaxID=1836972 RepID=A0A2I2KHX3_9ACTN|nr:SDR family oxidoreductase [Frankia canadensis]SNQ45265.1 Gluconate 5-dehydrogenase [Frankia canadensis]SOU52555.1 Gluconate 5-dehydrogenase [Frankia canadensis]
MQTFRSDALADRRALITGGSRGIGEAIAVLLASMGTTVVLAADDEPGLEKAGATIEGAGGQAELHVVDLLDPTAVADLATAAGDVDILINNAAPGQGRLPFLETPDEAWDLQLGLILRTSVQLIRALGPGMATRGRGSIVNISSSSVVDAAPYVAPYAAAKAGLEVVTRIAALELGPRGVRTNAVRPSFTPTQRVAHLVADPEFLAHQSRKVPLGRLAAVEDIANAVAWLCSDAASFVNGQVITVDGGGSAGTWRPPVQSDSPVGH